MEQKTKVGLEGLQQDVVGKLAALKKETEDKSRKLFDGLDSKSKRTFEDLRIMIWLTFALGFLLLITSLLTFLFQKQTLEVLGMGGLGAADLFALFLYKPMDRLQRASADLTQQLVILDAWVASVNLHILSIDPDQPDTVRTAAKEIGTLATDMARAIQEFVEK